MRLARHQDLRQWSAAIAVLAVLLQTALFGFLNSADGMAAMMGPAGMTSMPGMTSMAGMPDMTGMTGMVGSPPGHGPTDQCPWTPSCPLCSACCGGLLSWDAPPGAPDIAGPSTKPIALPVVATAGSAPRQAGPGLPPARGPPVRA